MWVSRATWEALEQAHHQQVHHLEQEIEWLRGALGDALDAKEEAAQHNRAMDRVERKLPERAPEPRVPDEPLPEKLGLVISLFPAEGTARRTLTNSIDQARRQGASWDDIYARVLDELPPEVVARLPTRSADE